jgi:hypothetical protein
LFVTWDTKTPLFVEGMKLYRKNVELAKRRRGRPPKQRLLLHGAVGVGDVGELAVGAEEEEPVSLFYNFDETQLPATVWSFLPLFNSQ